MCVELLDRGWIVELPNQRLHGGYTKGRPARRYALNHEAGVVVGVDAGQHRATAIVADLRATPWPAAPSRCRRSWRPTTSG